MKKAHVQLHNDYVNVTGAETSSIETQIRKQKRLLNLGYSDNPAICKFNLSNATKSVGNCFPIAARPGILNMNE